MVRLGLRLTLHSGREGFVRLVLTTAAVAIGVALLLGVLAEFHAFQANSNQPCWSCTTGSSIPSPLPARGDLWNNSVDFFEGQTIDRLDVAPLGPSAPVPRGISKLPGPGQYYASPALAALLRSVPADELGDRFPGTMIGTIGDAALNGPDDLVIYIGYQPTAFTAITNSQWVTTISAAPAQEVFTPYFRYAFGVGVLAVLFPVLVLIGTATRLAAARREERFAAIRLVGGTPRDIGVFAAVEAMVSAFCGALLGVIVFLLAKPVLASSAVVGTRYFPAWLTPTVWGYVAMLAGVPAAAAIAALTSLRRVQISPLGVSRRTSPPAPSPWRLATLGAGVLLYVVGLALSTRNSIGVTAYPGLLIILIGLVIAGPWLTAASAGLLARSTRGPARLLATRRLTDNPKAAARSVTVLVLAVFLGTLAGTLVPALDSLSATPNTEALSNVLVDSLRLPPSQGAQLLGEPHQFQGATVYPLYSLLQVVPGTSKHAGVSGGAAQVSSAAQLNSRTSRVSGGAGGQPAGGSGGGGQVSGGTIQVGPGSGGGKQIGPGGGGGNPGGETVGPGSSGSPGFDNSVINCAALRALAVLGQCAPGIQWVQANDQALVTSDNPQDSTKAFVSGANPAYTGNLSSLYLQAVLIRVNNPAALERVRTFLATHAPPQTPLGSGTVPTPPRTFGEALAIRESRAATMKKLVYAAVALTVLVAGCSLAVATGGGLVDRKRPFTLLRVSGTPLSTLYKVALLEAVVPLAAATVVAAVTAYGTSVLAVSRLGPAGAAIPRLGQSYYATMGAGLAVALLVIAATLPLLRRMTMPGNVRFE